MGLGQLNMQKLKNGASQASARGLSAMLVAALRESAVVLEE